nr:Co2+/Mg2+ efflux protein ApaG [uncultured Sphingomonas sp.]
MALLFPYEAVTGDIVVRVAVSYLPEQSAPSQGRWFWSYHVRIENNGSDGVQLLTRHWKITDGNGAVHEVAGQGVVGDMPLIGPGESYDYVSGCPLDTSSGRMEGSYNLIDAHGRAFEVAIPLFHLSAPGIPN